MKKSLKRQIKPIIWNNEEQDSLHSKPSCAIAGIIVLFSMAASIITLPSTFVLAAENQETAQNPLSAALGEQLPYSDASPYDMVESSSSAFADQVSCESISSAFADQVSCESISSAFADQVSCESISSVLAAQSSYVNPSSAREAGIALIKSFESCRLTAYKALASEQYYTIGWGHYGADVKEGMRITQAEADALLMQDLKKYEDYLNTFLASNGVFVNQSQYDALLSFTYNVGNVWASSRYPQFQLKTIMINGPQNYSGERIRDAFTGWNMSGGKVIEGLTRRRNAEADLFLSDRSIPAADKDQIRVFVSRLYRNFLSREADEGGLESWTAALMEGRSTGAKVVYGFVYSQEFQNNPLDNAAFVTAMYETIFGREPDEAGLSAWVSVLENGCTRKKVLGGFLNSDEMKRLCTSYGITAGSYESDEAVDRNTKVTYFVSRMYRCCLGRNADYDGLTNWVNGLAAGSVTGAEVASGFFFSREMEQKNLSNGAYVTNAYVALLDRQPDEGGLASWVSALESGKTRESIIEGFVKSEEFAGLCAEYGIRA